MAKTDLPVKIEPGMLEAIDRAADTDRRTRSDMVRLLLEEALAARVLTVGTEAGTGAA